MQWAIQYVAPGKLQLKKIPVPQPQQGEVLIKVLAAPINPSDLHFQKGYYHDHDLFKIHIPSVPGWEGSGVVVKSGGGRSTWGWVGCTVSFTRKMINGNEMVTGGSYQQYIVTDTNSLIDQTNSGIPVEICAM